MKLRNKKTGEIFDALIREKGGSGSYSLIVCDIKAYEQSKSTLDATHYVLEEYDSLAKLNDDWEDYKPTEPLIDDEKVRKTFETWAEINDLCGAKYSESANGCAFIFEHADGDKTVICFRSTWLGLEKGKGYTITELCGNEEKAWSH